MLKSSLLFSDVGEHARPYLRTIVLDPVAPPLFTCPACEASLQRLATVEIPCSTCCYPFDYGKTLDLLRHQRTRVQEVFGIESMSRILVRLGFDDALAVLAGDARAGSSLEYVSRRFVVYGLGNDAVVFSFDPMPLEDLDDLRRRLRAEHAW